MTGIKINPLKYLLVVCVLVLIHPTSGYAETKTMERDTNDDGKIDQIATFDDSGKLLKLAVDGDADGIMDRFQHYDEGKLVRLERDRDQDGKMDAWDHFEAEKRVRHERASLETGELELVIAFDSEERPLKMERITNGDGRFD